MVWWYGSMVVCGMVYGGMVTWWYVVWCMVA